MDLAPGIIGHKAVVGLLADEALAPAQAYLFTGPEGLGKATLARRFIAELLCSDTPDPARCRRRVAEGVHPDLVLVEPDGATAITVDQARRIVSQASLAPIESDRKVFLFEEAGLLNDEAANALLKTLEEPTESTVFVLISDSEDDLPSTVASRCRTVVFGRVSTDEIIDGLVARGVDVDQAQQAARISGGRPGLALGIATKPEVAAFRRAWLEIPLRLPSHPGDAFRLADEVLATTDPLLDAIKARQAEELETNAGVDPKVLKSRHERQTKRITGSLYVTGLEILASFYRDAAASQLGGATRNADIAPHDLTQFSPRAALASADRVLETIDVLDANQRPRLALAHLFADLGANGT